MRAIKPILFGSLSVLALITTHQGNASNQSVASPQSPRLFRGEALAKTAKHDVVFDGALRLASLDRCGNAQSDTIPLLRAERDQTVTEVRITPKQTLGGGSIRWDASIDDGDTWVMATTCQDASGSYCASFPDTVGNAVRWRAKLCSDAAHVFGPYVSELVVGYETDASRDLYKSGAISRDGIVYVGSARAAKDAGHLFAISDETGARLWDAAAVLDTQSSRRIYTTSAQGEKLSFTEDASAELERALGSTDARATRDLVAWFKSKRFGTKIRQTMGGIVNATPALLSPPAAPYWYDMEATTPEDRAAIDSYVAKYATRGQLIIVGARDGALHAFSTNPKNTSAPENGQEAWGFIPYDVARRLDADRKGGTVSAYPDGSPTLASARINGTFRTILVSGEGSGGRGVFALDVTDTEMSGPTPLWSFTDENMGKTHSKPTVVRMVKDGRESWLAVFASGKLENKDVGDTVYALDLATGTLAWRFDLDDVDCYVSTSVVAAETGLRDGFIDRLYFGDNKGRIWALDPTANIGTSITTTDSSLDVGLDAFALFSTRHTLGALDEERAITGNMAVTFDANGRTVLYFAASGTSDASEVSANAIYAIFAQNGAVRRKLDSEHGLAPGTKVWGGVAYNAGQLIFSANTGADSTLNVLDAYSLKTEFTYPTRQKILAPVFVQAGELYAVSASGQLVASRYTGSGK